MNAREFVAYAKQNAIDDTLTSLERELRSPRVFPQAVDGNDVERGISDWIRARQRRAQEKSEWFLNLNQEGQQRVLGLLDECAEMTLSSLFCLIDGVSGNY